MKKYILPIGLFIAALFIVGITVHANPAYFSPMVQTATATSSGAFMTPGTATSTLVYDTYNNGNTYANEKTELLLQFSGSSTAAQLNTTLEYANSYSGTDCSATPTSCDWYQDAFTNVVNYSTSTSPMSIGFIPTYAWTFASSTVGGIAPTSTNNRATRALQIKAPTRFVRAVFTCAIGGTNCTVWAQFNSTKERPE